MAVPLARDKDRGSQGWSWGNGAMAVAGDEDRGSQGWSWGNGAMAVAGDEDRGSQGWSWGNGAMAVAGDRLRQCPFRAVARAVVMSLPAACLSAYQLSNYPFPLTCRGPLRDDNNHQSQFVIFPVIIL